MDKAAFDPRLESMRGIAALVLCYTPRHECFRGGLDAAPAGLVAVRLQSRRGVMFFFVLSGYAHSHHSALRLCGAVRLCLRDPDSDWSNSAGVDRVFHETVLA